MDEVVMTTTITTKRKMMEKESDSIVCFERWDLEKLEAIKKLPLKVETKRSLEKLKLEIGATRQRVRYSTKNGDSEGRLYGNLVYHSQSYKKKNQENYRYDDPSLPREEEIYGGVSLQGMPGWIRRLIASTYYRDFDIANCAPVLLQQILERHNLCPPLLKYYNENRQMVFERYKANGTPKELKKLFLTVLHMGPSNECVPMTKSLKATLRQSLLSLKDLSASYQQLYANCEHECTRQKYSYLEKKTAEDRVTKCLGKFCAIVWQREEQRVLMSMRNYFITEQHYAPHHMVLCFDGMMLEKETPERVVDLEAVASHIFTQTGYKVRIEEKSLLPTTEDIWCERMGDQ
jgi:hypothetical protein